MVAYSYFVTALMRQTHCTHTTDCSHLLMYNFIIRENVHTLGHQEPLRTVQHTLVIIDKNVHEISCLGVIPASTRVV